MILSLIFLPMMMALVCYLASCYSREVRNIVASVTVVFELLLTMILWTQAEGQLSLNILCGSGLLFEVDGFRKVYCTVVAFMWCMTMLLGNQYFSHYKNCNRYYFFNLMTLGATMGVFLSGNLYTALVFFEIMSFTSYTWVIQEETEGAIRAANTYLAVAVIGGLTALMGLFLLSHTLGTTEIQRLYDLAQSYPDKTTLYIAGGCILFGFGAKAGMFPLHIWLPKAHPVAPAPASALLSGILTKSGIFGILVLSCELFRNDASWGNVILILGTITMVLGAVLALFSIDLKRTLACSSVSQIGFILVGIGMMGILGEENALPARGTILHMMNHSLFKLVLFLCAAIVYMNLHKLNLNDIRGFGRKKPLLLVCFLIGCLGIGGFPLFSGYISKTLLHEGIVEYIEILEIAGKSIFAYKIVEILFLLSGGITVAYMTKLFVCLFIEANENPVVQKQFDANHFYMNRTSSFALGLSAVLIPIFGTTSSWTMNRIAQTCMDFFHGADLSHTIHYFSWTNLKGGLISICMGAVLYFGFVRTCLMKQENGTKRYINRWPEKLDLEEMVYRPLLLKILSDILGWVAALFGENKITKYVAAFVLNASGKVAEWFGTNKLTTPIAKGVLTASKWVSHALSDLLDAIIYLLSKTIFRESPQICYTDETDAVSFRIGLAVDEIEASLGKEEMGSIRHARHYLEETEKVKRIQRTIRTSVSFALLMFCLASVIIFAYIVLIH